MTWWPWSFATHLVRWTAVSRREYLRAVGEMLKTAPWFQIGVGVTFWVTLYVFYATLWR